MAYVHIREKVLVSRRAKVGYPQKIDVCACVMFCEIKYNIHVYITRTAKFQLGPTADMGVSSPQT